MPNSIVYRGVPTCNTSALAKLVQFGVADLHESQAPIARSSSLLTASMRPVTPGLRIAGQAVTVATVPGDNLMLYAALDLIAPGQVLVMSNGGVANGALFGDVSASFSQKLGVAGVVIDGPLRDTDSLRTMSFPAWSTCISPSHPEKRGPGAVNVPISCGGCVINPGDVIVADDDAVLVLRPAELATVLAAAAARQAREVEYRRRIAAGEHICDIVGMRETLATAQIEYHDGLWTDRPGDDRS
jgi:4-hydroxy-4-methyl-2-oxoglutarate aldolase